MMRMMIKMMGMVMVMRMMIMMMMMMKVMKMMVPVLLKPSFYSDTWDDRSPLHDAASQGRLGVLKTLLSQVSTSWS
jgi:hypothetical protein